MTFCLCQLVDRSILKRLQENVNTGGNSFNTVDRRAVRLPRHVSH
jgi:hypothetical protein